MCVYTSHTCLLPAEAASGIRYPGVTDSCEWPCGCWELEPNACPLEEQPRLSHLSKQGLSLISVVQLAWLGRVPETLLSAGLQAVYCCAQLLRGLRGIERESLCLCGKHFTT